MIEFGEQDSPAFDEVMDVLKRHPDFEYQQLNEDSVLSIPGLEIYPNRRKIYQKIWGEDALGNESNTIKCHIRNLREKLYAALPDATFTIRCERKIGYCFELDTEQKHT